ncbi:MAG: hypothetical protein COB36_11080 [Alphaproteobacteria bacterium]|nr:MAG: hypothetical protein COB36_11080 [Alphaproteobacteria bacterium]
MINLKDAQFERIVNTETEVVSAAENIAGVTVHFLTISARASNNNFVRIGADKYIYYGSPGASPDALFITGFLVPKGEAITIASTGADSFICMGFEVMS